MVGDAIVAADRVEAVLGESARPMHWSRDRHWSDSLLRPFADLEPSRPMPASGWRVLAGEFVDADEGTGIVHLAPAFGEIDREVGPTGGLPTLNPVGPDGRFTDEVAWLQGQPVRDTNRAVDDRLEAAGLLVRRAPTVTRTLIAGVVRPRSSTGASRAGTFAPRPGSRSLVAENQTIGWHPEHIRDGRMGEWLSNNVDWALSRDRFWGTPLPVWRCDQAHLRCVGSLVRAVRAGRPRCQ